MVNFLWKKVTRKPVTDYVQLNMVDKWDVNGVMPIHMTDIADNWEAAQRPVNVQVAPIVTRLARGIDGALTVSISEDQQTQHTWHSFPTWRWNTSDEINKKTVAGWAHVSAGRGVAT